MKTRASFCGALALALALTPRVAAQDARQVRLFDTNDILDLRVATDFRSLMNERDSNKLQEFPATMTYAGPDGQPVTVDVSLKLRGHWRRQKKNCDFAPIKVDFPPGARRGTIFADQGDLKLVTHCRRNAEHEQYVLREYLVYQLYNILTPVSLRARLVRATYIDTTGRTDSTTRYAFFIENEKKAAERNRASVLEIKGAVWDNVDPEAGTLVSAFQYLIGGTDWSLVALHNIVLFQEKESGTVYPMAYDFDWSGLVNARYAFPDYRLPIKSVRERLYRGICRTPEEWQPVIKLFQDKREALYAVYDRLPDLDQRYARQSREYLDDFYKTLEDPKRHRQEMIQTCRQA